LSTMQGKRKKKKERENKVFFRRPVSRPTREKDARKCPSQKKQRTPILHEKQGKKGRISASPPLMGGKKGGERTRWGSGSLQYAEPPAVWKKKKKEIQKKKEGKKNTGGASVCHDRAP